MTCLGNGNAIDIEKLVEYGIKLARPRFCEVILSRFVGRIRAEAKSVEDVDKIYSEMRHGRNSGKIRVAT